MTGEIPNEIHPTSGLNEPLRRVAQLHRLLDELDIQVSAQLDATRRLPENDDERLSPLDTERFSHAVLELADQAIYLAEKVRDAPLVDPTATPGDPPLPHLMERVEKPVVFRQDELTAEFIQTRTAYALEMVLEQSRRPQFSIRAIRFFGFGATELSNQVRRDIEQALLRDPRVTHLEGSDFAVLERATSEPWVDYEELRTFADHAIRTLNVGRGHSVNYMAFARFLKRHDRFLVQAEDTVLLEILAEDPRITSVANDIITFRPIPKPSQIHHHASETPSLSQQEIAQRLNTLDIHTPRRPFRKSH